MEQNLEWNVIVSPSLLYKDDYDFSDEGFYMHLLEDLSDEVVEGSIEECISMCL